MKVHKSATIGIENFVVFPFDNKTMKYGEPMPISTIKSIDVSINVATHDEYNDNQLFESTSLFSNAEISCEFTDLTPAEQAILLGWKSDGAIKMLSNSDVAPTFAIAYKRTKQDGNSKLVKFLSCTARLEGESGKTASDSIETQPEKLIFKAKPLRADFPIEKYRKLYQLKLDTSDENYTNEADDWFLSAIPLKDLKETSE